MERRTLQSRRPHLVRADGGKPTRIEGYAAVFYRADDAGTEYELFRMFGIRFVERLMPGCFDRAIREDDVRALFNHDVSLLLGRTTAGTCRLLADSIGLRYEITPPDATYAKDLMACLQRGDVTGSSFLFDYLDTSDREVKNPDGSELDILEVRDVKLYDVGPVTFPAYTSTTSEARFKGDGRLSPALKRRYADRVAREAAQLCGTTVAAGSPRSHALPSDPDARSKAMRARLLEVDS